MMHQKIKKFDALSGTRKIENFALLKKEKRVMNVVYPKKSLSFPHLFFSLNQEEEFRARFSLNRDYNV